MSYFNNFKLQNLMKDKNNVISKVPHVFHTLLNPSLKRVSTIACSLEY